MKESNILNKKGFTLLELLIAVSIFGIVSVMTFSIINYVPKLAKSEASQFSERTYVRRAVTEITDTIQSASKVTINTMEFEMPNGDKVVYKYEDGNVNKYINGVPQRLMESMTGFQITSPNEHLFNIHIKTANEGKVYDFKVEKRRDIRTKTDAVISTISPASAVFDKYTSPKPDISITLNLNGNELNGLKNGGYTLVSGIDYTISGSIVIIKASYLSGLAVGNATIEFDVTNGVDPKLAVEIRNTASYTKIEGNAYTDDIVRMYYPGNLQVDTYDDKWIISVTNASLNNTINNSDLEITGLPVGITANAVKAEDVNNIEITLSGTTSAPVSTTRTVEVIVKASAVSNTNVSDSAPIEVLLLPGATFASPEHNLLFTNEVYIKNNATITGDIVIGRGEDITYIETQCNLYGTIYVDSSLDVKNNIVVGSSDKPSRLFVKGSATFGTQSTIYGDLFYRDELKAQNGLTVTGRKEQRAVEIPPINIPTLKQPEQWYEQNGYIVKTDSYMELKDLQSNKKYFFTRNVEFRNDSGPLNNITIVGKGDIIFSNKFKGSGIIFAPNGKVYFKNGCDFTGMCVSNRTELNTDCTLKFQRYPDLPFDYEQ